MQENHSWHADDFSAGTLDRWGVSAQIRGFACLFKHEVKSPVLILIKVQTLFSHTEGGCAHGACNCKIWRDSHIFATNRPESADYSLIVGYAALHSDFISYIFLIYNAIEIVGGYGIGESCADILHRMSLCQGSVYAALDIDCAPVSKLAGMLGSHGVG